MGFFLPELVLFYTHKKHTVKSFLGQLLAQTSQSISTENHGYKTTMSKTGSFPATAKGGENTSEHFPYNRLHTSLLLQIAN